MSLLRRIVAEMGPIEAPVMLVVAHQDDEVIGLGSVLPRLPNLRVVHVTDGAPDEPDWLAGVGFASRTDYAAARAAEARAAMALVGIGPERMDRLEIIDQQAAFHLGEITAALVALMRQWRPEAVVTHPFENGHPDHDSTAFAVHLACHSLRDAGETAPELIEFASYHDPDGSGRLVVQEFLPADTTTVMLELDEAGQALKRRLYAAHASQASVLQGFPTDRERLREAPAYDFLAAPHPWRPLYERLFSTMTRERWQGLAAETLARHGVSGRLRC